MSKAATLGNVTLRFSELKDYVAKVDPEVIVAAIGPPGTGKSACMAEAAQQLGPEARFDDIDLTTMVPEDFGCPFMVDGYTKFAPPWFLKPFERGSGAGGADPVGLICFEDLPHSPQNIQKALAKLLGTRRLNNMELSRKVRIVVTGNRAQDKAGARELFSHIKNRIVVVELQPDLEEWMTWAYTSGLPAVIGSFLQLKPQFFAQLPTAADKVNGQFATPRSWHKAGLVLNSLKDAPEHIKLTFVAGAVGLGVGTEFMAFVKLQKDLPDPKAVLLDPKGAMPNPPTQADRLTALVTALGEYAAANQASKKVYLQLLIALAHVCGKQREYCAAGLTVFQANGGNVARLFDAASQNKSDPRIMALIKHFAAAVSGGGV